MKRLCLPTMQHRQYQPHPTLARAIHCFWTSSRDFSTLNGALDILPDGYVELIFNFGADWEIETQHRRTALTSPYVVGLLDEPFRLHTGGQLSTVGVRFFAWGFTTLTKMQIAPNQILALEGRFWQATYQRIGWAVDREEGELAVSLLQDALLEFVLRPALDKDRETAETTAELQQASQLLSQHQGMKVEALAAHCHLSRRQLERKFSRSIGIPPKALARKLRFQATRDQLCQQPTTDLSELALQMGYADQAHLTREFKQYSRRTPSQFAAEIMEVQEPLRYGVAFSK